MDPDTPATATVCRGGVTVTADFAAIYDATQFIHAQARAATAAGQQQMSMRLTAGGHVHVDITLTGPDLVGAAVSALARFDADGLGYLRVPGHQALVYAHRSRSTPGALLVGVDADEGERICMTVNDGDLVDTTVGRFTGAVNAAPTGDGFEATCEIVADSWGDADRIAGLIACSQPVRFATISQRRRLAG